MSYVYFGSLQHILSLPWINKSHKINRQGQQTNHFILIDYNDIVKEQYITHIYSQELISHFKLQTSYSLTRKTGLSIAH